tara:strand:- start:1164 stop:2003 length:840 start_codon:yes stop_codon:yes gene_type:complete
MNFKKGFKIKPSEVSQSGEVIFTDGTNKVVPNQLACEAYGYKYNADTSTCVAYNYNTKIQEFFSNIKNNQLGADNTTEKATNKTLLNGTNNKTKGSNNNCLVNGQEHELTRGLNNTNILAGSFAKALNQGEVVIGGGGFGTTLGLAQTSFVQQSGQTENDTETLLTTQNLNSTHIQKVANAVIAFEANVIGIDISDQSTFDYAYIQITGAVKFDNSLTSTYHQTRTNIVAPGISGLTVSAVMKDAEAISFAVAVTGLEEKTIQWTADIKLWQNKTLKTF